MWTIKVAEIFHNILLHSSRIENTIIDYYQMPAL